MGAGAAIGVGVRTASDIELQEVLAQLPADAVAKLSLALEHTVKQPGCVESGESLSRAKSWSKPVAGGALRNRLMVLGETFSIEVGPSDVALGEEGKSKKKGQSLLELIGDAGSSGRQLPLRPHAHVYINMVKPVLSHFDELCTASKALLDADYVPVPHLPAARFETSSELQLTLEALSAAGAQQLLLLGGNDLFDRAQTGRCAYADGARGILASELNLLKAKGIKAVTLAGHPTGHPALNSASATAEVLADKVKLVLRAGLSVAIATQFCFDARKLISWLDSTRRKLQQIAEDVFKEQNMSPPSGCVTFCIGLPGPTPRKKLERIAKICDVPSLFISSEFDIVDVNGDGVVTLQELHEHLEKRGIARRNTQLHRMYIRHAGADGLLQADEFAQLLVEDAQASVSEASILITPRDKDPEVPKPTEASGPSVFVGGSAAGCAGTSPEWIWPAELVLTIAGYCEREQVPTGEIVLHFFPFGGLAKTFELTAMLSDGSWPSLTSM